MWPFRQSGGFVTANPQPQNRPHLGLAAPGGLTGWVGQMQAQTSSVAQEVHGRDMEDMIGGAMGGGERTVLHTGILVWTL